MSRFAFLALNAVAASLSATLMFEAARRDAETRSVQVLARSEPRPLGVAGKPTTVDHTGEWVATALARPLFSGTRRPPAETASSVTPNSELPRLSRILISSSGKSVIFAPPDGKPVVAREGSSIGAYVVRSIQAEQVTVEGSQGTRVLAPSLDRAPSISSNVGPASTDGPPARHHIAKKFKADPATESRSALGDFK